MLFRSVVLHITAERVPRLSSRQRLKLQDLGDGFYRIDLHYGFMEHPDVPRSLRRCMPGGATLDMMDTTFFLSRELIGAARVSQLNAAVRTLFAWLHRNATDVTDFFRIPRNRMVELGGRIEI